MNKSVCVQEEERKRQEEQERQRRERRYVLPDEPTILVHPNLAAKNGKFDCSIMSLSVLLDYRLEDNKEHSFEVRMERFLKEKFVLATTEVCDSLSFITYMTFF